MADAKRIHQGVLVHDYHASLLKVSYGYSDRNTFGNEDVFYAAASDFPDVKKLADEVLETRESTKKIREIHTLKFKRLDNHENDGYVILGVSTKLTKLLNDMTKDEKKTGIVCLSDSEARLFEIEYEFDQCNMHGKEGSFYVFAENYPQGHELAASMMGRRVFDKDLDSIRVFNMNQLSPQAVMNRCRPVYAFSASLIEKINSAERE